MKPDTHYKHQCEQLQKQHAEDLAKIASYQGALAQTSEKLRRTKIWNDKFCAALKKKKETASPLVGSVMVVGDNVSSFELHKKTKEPDKT